MERKWRENKEMQRERENGKIMRKCREEGKWREAEKMSKE